MDGLPQQEMTFWEKMQLVQNLSIFPALPGMVFLRRKIGFRRVKMTYVLAMAGLIFLSNIFFRSEYLAAFAVAVAGMGYWQNRQRWIGLKNGEMWHTHSNGVSWLEYMRLPAFLYDEERIYRYVDPMVMYLIGLGIGVVVDHGIGGWLMVSGAAIAVREQYEYELRLNRLLDMHDAQIDAQAARGYSARSRAQQKIGLPMKDAGSYGIPTGIGEDIREQVERRQAEMEAQKQYSANQKLRAEAQAAEIAQAVTFVTDTAPEPTAASSAPDNLA